MIDPRAAYALPARVPRVNGHQPRPAALRHHRDADPGEAEQFGPVLFVPDHARAADRARVLAQLAEGRRRIAEYRAIRQRT